MIKQLIVFCNVGILVKKMLRGPRVIYPLNQWFLIFSLAGTPLHHLPILAPPFRIGKNIPAQKEVKTEKKGRHVGRCPFSCPKKV